MSIQQTQAGAVRVLQFARPERKNAITGAMYTQLGDGLLSAIDDPAVRVVLVCGNEAGFTAGNDLGDFLNHPPRGEETPVSRFLRAVASFPKPLVAAVNGMAVGVGTTMLLHCDLVYASEEARLSLPFVNLGLCPEAASSLLLPMRAGYARAAEKLMLGEPFGAQEAREMGLVNRVVPLAELRDTALAQCQKLAAKPLTALMETKRLMRQASMAPVASTMAEEGAVFGRLLVAPAAKEAFTAFMEKRAPDFSRL